MWDYGRKLKPETAKEVAEEMTVEGMRKRILEYSRDDAMVRSILDSARFRGLSGDDAMTMLAYHALLERERFRDMCLEQTMLNPMQPLIITSPAA